MSKGFDTTEDCTEKAAALIAAGYSFVARYSSHSPWKNMTKAEAAALSRAGMYLVNVWESAGDHQSFFTGQQGGFDGAAALAFARSIGQPFASPIYFAVDCDADPSAIQAYFAGVRGAFRRQGTIGQDVYGVGVYGSGAVCSHLTQIGYVSFTWLAQARGWSGSEDYEDWNIRQLAGTTLMGMQVDEDVASPKGGGGWRLGK